LTETVRRKRITPPSLGSRVASPLCGSHRSRARPAASASTNLRLGFDDDTLKWMSRPNGDVGVHHDLGVRTTRITVPWRRGEVRPRRVSQTYLNRAAKAIVLGQDIVIAVYGPLRGAGRRAVAEPVLLVRPSRARRHSEDRGRRHLERGELAALLAERCGCSRVRAAARDVLGHAASAAAPVNVIDSTASHYDPAGFIRALGDAYRESGRMRPIVDTFGHNPYRRLRPSSRGRVIPSPTRSARATTPRSWTR